VFRPHARRSPFADFIDWTDYRFDGPMRHQPRAPWGQRRRHPLVRVLVILAIIWFVARLLRNRRASSWF
jgi:hypothetical protein